VEWDGREELGEEVEGKRKRMKIGGGGQGGTEKGET